MFNYESMNVQQVKDGVKKFGPAVGSRIIIDAEFLHAQESIQSGIYITFSCASKKSECTRVGSKSKCFCGHQFSNHKQQLLKRFNTACENCPCKRFKFVPSRPEECGMWWLPRRKEFNVTLWRAPCKCIHTCEEHSPNYPLRCLKCKCQDFQSYFACISCDGKWEEHELLFETQQERQELNKSIGSAFLPLAQNPDIQQEVFKDQNFQQKQIEQIQQQQTNLDIFPIKNQQIQYKTQFTRERPKSLMKQLKK